MMNKIFLYNMCMISNKNGDVLVQKRLRGMPGYTFPGGKIFLNESIEESVKREVYEETGLTIINPVFKATVSFYDLKSNERRQIFLFQATSYSGALVSSNSEGEYFWSSMDAFLQLPLVDGMEEFLQAYKQPQLEWHYNT